MFILVLVLFFKERIKKKWYELRYPEKLIKVVVHYSGNVFKEYWRVIPSENEFFVEDKIYLFNDKKLIKDNHNTFVWKDSKGELKLTIDGKDYDLDLKSFVQKRWRSYPEIHYFFNNPNPLSFEISDKKIDFSAEVISEFKENNLFRTLLTMDAQKSMMIFCILLGIINLIVSGVVLSKLMGWIK